MKILAFALPILICGCAAQIEFRYKPVKFGTYEEGYEETSLDDGSILLKVISTHNHDRNLLEHYFHFRASERCNGYNYQLLEFKEMIDVCADAKCFESAVAGRYKCT